MHGDHITPRDQVADRLRRHDAQLRGHTAALLPWQQITEPEQNRWHGMADEAFAAIQAVQDIERLSRVS